MGKKIFELSGLISVDGLAATVKGLKDLGTQFEKAEKSFYKFGRQVGSAGEKLTKSLTVPIAAFAVGAYKGVEAASNLAETVSKIGQIFGESGAEIADWSKTTAQSMGQSRQSAMDAAATFGIYGKSAGLAGRDLVKFSTDFTKLASDLASFHNTKPQEAIDAIGSALRGEALPLRRFGILLDEATLKAAAFKMGLITTTKEALTPQNKVLAAQAVIFKQSKDAQGDFARTSAGLANQQRILTAEVENMVAELGQGFLPIALEVVSAIREKIFPAIKKLVDGFNGMSAETKRSIVMWAAFVAATGPALIAGSKLIGAIAGISTAIKILRGAFIGLSLAMSANPFALAVIGVAALGVAIWGTKKAYDNLIASHRQFNIMTTSQAGINEFTAGVADLTAKLIALGDASKNESVVEEKLGKDIDGMTEKARALGYVLEGNTRTKIEGLSVIAAELKGVRDATGALIKYKAAKTSAAAGEGDGINPLSDAELREAERLAAEKERVNAEYNKKLFDNTLMSDEARYIAERDMALEYVAKIGGDVGLAYEALTQERNKKLREEQSRELAIKKETAVEEVKIQEDVGQKVADMYNSYLSTISEIGQGIAGIFQQSTANKAMALDNQQQKERDAINNSLMSEKEKRKALDALDKKQDAEQRKMRRKQASESKKISIFESVIGTAAAVASALPNLILAGIVGIIGAAKTALIAAAPLPLASGGLIRKQSGGILAQIGEGDQDEIVLPMRSGVKELAARLMSTVREQFAPMTPAPFLAAAGGAAGATAGRGASVVHYNIGTFIGDDRGIKEFERRQLAIRNAEAQRKGQQ